MTTEEILWCNKKIDWLRSNRESIIGIVVLVLPILLCGIIEGL